MDAIKWAWMVPGLWIPSAWGQISLSADTNRIQWGERVEIVADWELTLEALHALPIDPWGSWEDSLRTTMDVLASTPLDTLAAPLGSDADVLLRQSWTATSFDSGFVVIKPILWGNGTSNPLMVEVLTPQLNPDAQPQPPADIVGFEPTFWDRAKPWLGWILGSLLTIGLGLVLWRILKNWKRKTNEGTGIPELVELRPPHEIALAILNRLALEEGWKRGLEKDVHVEASLAVRYYIEGRFSFQAAERTTAEIKELIRTSPIPQAWHGRLVAAFEAGDMVKFAKGSMSELAHRETIQGYIEFVKSTQPDE
jgi:hypothetical protein